MRLLTTAVLVVGLAGSANAQTFEFERRLPASGNQLAVTTERGKVDIRAGTSGDVVIRGRVSVRVGFNVPADGVALARVTAAAPPISTDATGIALRLPDDERTRRAVNIAWDVEVPAGMTVISASDSGETTVRGVTGSVSVTTQSGRITVDGLGGDTVVRTGSGEVTADGVAGLFDVTTSSSSISATALGGGLRVRTDSGRVTARFSGTGDADIETGSSRIALAGLRGGLTASTESGQVTVAGSPLRDWRISTGSSRIEVTMPATTSFVLDASSGSSSVTTTNMMVRGETSRGRVAGEVDGGGPTVTLRSRSGAIQVVRGGRPSGTS